MKHRSILNKKIYEEKRDKAIALIEELRESWKLSQIEKIGNASSDKEKWCIINDMTNCDVKMEVQPIRYVDESTKKVE